MKNYYCVGILYISTVLGCIMTLTFIGGVRPDSRTTASKKKIEYYADCTSVCYPVSENSDCELFAEPGERVYAGQQIAKIDGLPVYSSVSGEFRGYTVIADERFLVVISDGQKEYRSPLMPESRRLTDIPREEIIELARSLGIADSRSGKPLYALMSEVKNCMRIVVDCTESDPLSAIAYRLCVEKAESIVGGSKVLMYALDAEKGVFAAEYYRKMVFSALREQVSDDSLFAFAELDEKYPYTDRTLMDALYVRNMPSDATPADEGVLIVGPEAVCALYDGLLTGMPHITRYVSVCGKVENEKNLCVPSGITVHDIMSVCGRSGGSIIAENSLLSGRTARGYVSAEVRALICTDRAEKKILPCIGCGACSDACTMRLTPKAILGADRKTHEYLRTRCTACGCCEYICPCGIPLMTKILREVK